MYFTICYDIVNPTSLDSERISEYFKNTLNKKNLFWTRPISNIFFIKCNNEEIRLKISQDIISFSGEVENKGKLKFLISPLFDEGRYIGLLHKDFWPILKRITISDISELEEELFGPE